MLFYLAIVKKTEQLQDQRDFTFRVPYISLLVEGFDKL